MPEHTIAENLSRLVTAKTDIANAITTMGGTVNTGDGFEEFPSDILGIPSGGEIIEGTIRSGSSTTNNRAYRIGNMVFVGCTAVGTSSTTLAFYVDGLNVSSISQNLRSCAAYTAIAATNTGKMYSYASVTVTVADGGSLYVTVSKPSMVTASYGYDPFVTIMLLVDE